MTATLKDAACAPRVLAAMAQNTIGHLDPEFVRLMDEIKLLLRAMRLVGQMHDHTAGRAGSYHVRLLALRPRRG